MKNKHEGLVRIYQEVLPLIFSTEQAGYQMRFVAGPTRWHRPQAPDTVHVEVPFYHNRLGRDRNDT
jgi:hypothetical protein